METIYTSINRFRLPKFQIETSIVKDGQSIIVVKKALSEEAIEHIDNIYENYSKLKNSIVDNSLKLPSILYHKKNSLEFEFIKGNSLLHLFLKSLLLKNKNVFLKLLDIYYNIIFNSFSIKNNLILDSVCKELFKELNIELLKNEKVLLSPSFIDLIPENIILFQNSYYLTDLEWIFNSSLPASFIFFRGIRSFLDKNNWKSFRFDSPDFITLQEIYQRYSLPGALIEQYSEMEVNFQNYVHGDNKYNLRYQYLKQGITIDNIESQISQLLRKLDEKEQSLKEVIQNNTTKITNLTKNIVELDQIIKSKEIELGVQQKEKDETIASINFQLKIKEIELNNLSELLSAKEKDIEFKEREIGEINSELNKRSEVLEEKVKEIYRLLSLIKGKDEQLIASEESNKKLADEIKSKSIAFENLELKLNDKEQEISASIINLNFVKEENSALNKTIQGLHSELSAKETLVENKDDIIKEHVNIIGEKDSIIKSLYANNMSSDLIIGEKEELLISKMEYLIIALQKLEDSEEIKTNLQKDLNGKTSEIDSLNNRIAEKDNRINALKESLSYKLGRLITLPVRIANDFINREGRFSRINKNVKRKNLLWLAVKFGSTTIKNPIKMIKEINLKNLRILKYAVKYENPELIAKNLKNLLGLRTEISQRISPPIISKPKNLLIFPKFSKPEVSIIIPVYNKWAYTYDCLESILLNSTGLTYEIIIVDDQSTDETRNVNRYAKNIITIRNKNNLGFLKNCNKGAIAAKGKFILFLNNDTTFQKDCLNILIDTIEWDNKIGLVGPKLVYPDGRLQEAGGIIWKDASGWNYGKFDDPEKPEYNYVKEVDYISGAAILVRKDLWNEIGGFDERYTPAYAEDTDLSFEIRKRGYKVIYQPKSVIVHLEGISGGTDINSGVKSYQVINKEKFYKKWQEILKQEHFINAENVFQARDRSRYKKTILFIDHYVPHYDQDAGSKTVFQYLKILAEMGFNVKFLGDNFYRHEPYTTDLQQIGIEVLYGVWFRDNWKKWVSDNSSYIDFVFLNRPHISINYIDFIRGNTKAKIIYYGHDLHYLRYERLYDLTKDPKHLEEMKYWEKMESEIFKKSDVVLYPSDVEIKRLKTDFSGINAYQIPAYIFDAIKEIPKMEFSERKDLLFVGGFRHPPNLDGLKWFVEKIFPLVINKIPEIKLNIAGSNTPDEIIKMESANINIKGYLSDEELMQLYGKVRLVIIPLRYGAGVKGKTVEAMYCGVPVVSTGIGLEGLPGIEKIINSVDLEKDFSNRIISLYLDIHELKKLSKLNRKYVDKNFSKDLIKNNFNQVLNK